MLENFRRAALFILAVFICPAAASGQQNQAIYIDALGSGWQDWSWNTTRDFNNASPVHGDGGKSIAVTYTAAWAGLYLHNNTNVLLTDYSAIRFWIHGGTTGGHLIQVLPFDSAGHAGTAVGIPATTAGTWTNVEIAISSFAFPAFSGFAWQDRRGAAQPVYYLDDIELVAAGPPPPGPGPALSVDVAADRHAISPLIYGWNFAGAQMAAELSLPINRWGGNATTRYNWQLDTSNRASDWYFENIPDSNPNPGQLPNGSNADRFVEQNLATGTDSLITVPLIGWTPKDRAYACGFSVAKYGPQQKTDPWRPDCGNGVRTDGTYITGNDPADTSIAITPAFVSDWIAHLAGRYGTADQGGVRFYDLDNEPMLWNSTHRDVHPGPTTYEEIRDRTIQYASAIKAADPAAFTLGPVVWGWCAYFYSALDGCGPGTDYASHGNAHFVPWYLRQMRAYEQQQGVRILDYLDMHYYPQGNNVALSSAGDAVTQALRLRSTRSLWDPTYADESWIANVQDGPYVRLIPRMKQWVAENYPGTKLAITEYNFGGLEHINGALAQADVLGIFGREGLDLATLWDPPQSAQPGAFAYRIYRNYDGAGRKFGETSVRAVSEDQGRVSIYASQRSDNRLTIILINKTNGILTSSLSISSYPSAACAQVYRYSAADPARIVREQDVAVAGGTVSIQMPASSITLLVVPPALAQADFDGDTDVDRDDYKHFQQCSTGPGLGPPSSGCANADLDGDADVDQSDFGLFQRCLSGPYILADPGCTSR
ncbi:MAG TPA: glycoside hydrolase family 44 protein [Phycisphaerae bacterium]|nr:glycoside hydrolase family 44 protein [Phycisphaerae bacterium]HRR83675.1 glycoside hydrolase family 44 protein [Phycisphaerae bacterium]